MQKGFSYLIIFKYLYTVGLLGPHKNVTKNRKDV